MKKAFTSFALLMVSLFAWAAESDMCMKYVNPKAGAELWHAQATYSLSSPLNKDMDYTLTMKVKATTATDLALWPIYSTSPNRNQWRQSTDVQQLEAKQIGTDWQTVTWKFKASFPHDRLQFVFGKLEGSIYFDDVVLKADEIGVNYVQNGDFAENKVAGWGKSQFGNVSFSIVYGESDKEPEVIEPVIPEKWEYAKQGDPNFHIYLCFGQSNMEGNAPVEPEDLENVPERMQLLAAVNFSNPARTQGQWYTAVPPLCRQGTGLTPADYFGRTLCEKLPDSIRIGIVHVAVGGAKIELYMEEYKDNYIAGEADWFRNFCAQYDNDPLARLIEMGKIAQQSGVIKGILLHQGCSNNGQADWAKKVKKVYTRICYQLGLNPEEVPLLAGETLYEDQKGACWLHNVNSLPLLPKEMPNAYVISAKDIPGNGRDPFHFSAAGYRELGRRYADQMLKILNNK